MFRIHQAQMDFLNRKERAIYLERLDRYLEASYPECFDEMSSEERREWVEDAVSVCDRYGIKTEYAATQLVLLLLILGLDADETYPWFSEIVESEDLTAEGKVRVTIRRMRAEGMKGLDNVLLDNSWEAA